MSNDVAVQSDRDASMNEPRLDELRDLARALADDESVESALRVIAEGMRSIAGAVAVHIERYGGADDAAVALVSAGPNVPSTEDLNREVEGADRIVISLGRKNERLGSIVLWRAHGARAVEAEDLERVRDLANMATLALRRGSLEADLKQAHEESDRITENKFRLISGISDELKNRLGAAAEYVQLLDTEGELTERELNYINGSRRSIDAAVHLINEMVQLARAETGRLSIQLESVNIGAVLRGIVRDYRLSVGTIGVEFDLRIPNGLPIVLTDVDHVRQVLDNLLTNAVRYTPAGGRIVIAADVRPGRRKSDPSKYVCLSVSDTGPGIGDQQLIFEEVYRVERRGGTPGFRLAISRRIARLLGGELTLESRPGSGSTFTLWLPGSPPHAQET